MPWWTWAIIVWALLAVGLVSMVMWGLDAWFHASMAVSFWWRRWKRRRYPLKVYSWHIADDWLVHGSRTQGTRLPAYPLWFACHLRTHNRAIVRAYGKPITCLTCSAILSGDDAPE